MAEDSTGLHVKGVLNLRTDRGREAFEHEGWRRGREYAGKGAFHLKEIELLEVSVVSVPANPRARITGVKSLGSKAEAIDMLRECGLSRQARARFAAGGWKALAGEDIHEKAIQFAAALDRAAQRMRTDK